jgi:hypothetical protein
MIRQDAQIQLGQADGCTIRCVLYSDTPTGSLLDDLVRVDSVDEAANRVRTVLQLKNETRTKLFSRVVALWPNRRLNGAHTYSTDVAVMNAIKPFRLPIQPWIHVVLKADTLAAAITANMPVQPLYVEYVDLPAPSRRILWIYVLPPLVASNELLTQSTLQMNQTNLWDGSSFTEPRYYLAVDEWLQAHTTAVASRIDRMVLRSDPAYFVHIAHAREAPLPSFEDWSAVILRQKQGDLLVWLPTYAHLIAPLVRSPTSTLSVAEMQDVYDQHWRTDCQTIAQSEQRAVLQYLTLVVAMKHRFTLFPDKGDVVKFAQRFIEIAQYILVRDLLQLCRTSTADDAIDGGSSTNAGDVDFESVLLTLRLNAISWTQVLNGDALKPYDDCIKIITNIQLKFWQHTCAQLEHHFATPNDAPTDVERAIVNALMLVPALETIPNVDDSILIKK